MRFLWRFADFTRLFRDLILIIKVKKIETQGFSGKDATRAGNQAWSPDAQPVDSPDGCLALIWDPNSIKFMPGKRSLLVTTFGQNMTHVQARDKHDTHGPITTRASYEGWSEVLFPVSQGQNHKPGNIPPQFGNRWNSQDKPQEWDVNAMPNTVVTTFHSV